VLELRDVGFGYAPGDWVFRGVSFELEPGTVTSVLGPNGSGKTTLVRCAAGLLTPQEGSVLRATATGFVPQARGTAFAYPVRDMVVMGRAAHVRVFGVPSRGDRAAADAAMDRVGITELADRAFPTLSGGEQQLVLVARAVASGHPVMVLDEPATGLDLRNQVLVLALVRSLADDGLTVLLTTHHPDHARFLSDAVVLIRGPADVQHGRADALLTEPVLSALYGVPVHEVDVPGAGPHRRALVTGYRAGPGRRPLSSGPVPDRSARGHR
jgi:iron complex transport system ATP-binding protein